MTTTLKINVPSEIFSTLNVTETEFIHSLKQSAAMSYYMQNKLTLGKASELAGVSKFDFENMLSANDIPISILNFEDVENEIRIKNFGQKH
jgi:predicted HTH domain antitoxin